MGALKSERHHWWPRCLSKRWAGDDGCVGWLTPDDVLTRAPPKNFGVIGNGHHIRLGRGVHRDTPFDESFEAVFQRADDGITHTVDWLSRLVSDPPTKRAGHEARFSVHSAPDGDIGRLVELLVSLAIRSPMNRQAAVAVAEALRGPLPEVERNALIGLNMRDSHSRATKSIGTSGKFVVLSSPKKEFIFGDGFFHNVTSPAATPVGAKILAPLTPRISVLFAKPWRYATEPKLMTLELDEAEADTLNTAVQVYSKDAIFFRTERPTLIEDYRRREHRQFNGDNPIDNLIGLIPGASPSF